MPGKLLSRLLDLPEAERAQLAELLWDSLPPDRGSDIIEIPPALETELERRWQEHLADPASSIPWETIRQELTRQS